MARPIRGMYLFCICLTPDRLLLVKPFGLTAGISRRVKPDYDWTVWADKYWGITGTETGMRE